MIESKPDWGQVTLRKAAGWIAQAAGCFLRVNRLGELEMAGCAGGEVIELGPEAYWNLDDGFQSWGPVAAVQVKNGGDSFSVGSAGETILVQGNPLFQTEAVAAGMLAQVQGLKLEACSFVWRGEPSVGVGSRIALTDTYGSRKICTVTRQTMKFDRGFSAQVICSVPDSGDGGIVRAITPEGGLNAGALVGTVDGGLLAAESVAAKSIAAQSITAQKLAAGAVTADKLDAQSVSAQVAKFVAAEMAKLSAGSIETDELYAAFAHVIALSAGSIAAGKIEADVLAAALAEVVSLYAGTGEFDFATIQNLVAKAMALDQGAMDTVYIRNLAVTSANMLSATLGKLVIKGEDGKYYRVFVGSDGMISTEEVPDGGLGEEIEGGRQIVETTMNVGSLNATNLQASSAVINSILTTALSAEKITAADALIASATIPALYATTIQAIGNSLELIVGRKRDIWRGEEMPGEARTGDLWIQPGTGYIYQMVNETAAQFYLDAAGVLYADGGSYYMDESGDLYALPEDAFALGPDGEVLMWQRVKDGDLSAAELKLTPQGIMSAVTGTQQWKEMENAADEADAKLALMRSEFTQRMDGFELSVERMVDGDELQTYLRYQDGRVEIGRSDSRYTTETSDKGFVVLQDGAEMTSMTKNTVSAPVVEAKRQFVAGNFVIRAGADGGLLIL